MAKLEFNDIDGLILDMDELANMPDSVLTEMLNAEADIIVEAQKSKAMSMGVVDTGLTAASIQKGKQKKTNSGRSIYVYPKDSRTRNGRKTQNAEIAFINEFGKRGQPARPFIKAANEEKAGAAVEAAEKIYDDYLKSKNL